MNIESLSHTLLPGNNCFGCGPMNPHGLNITVRLDHENTSRIVAEFNPQNHMIGFPGITHGGVIYTALDCMASWSGMVLHKTKAIWILRSASMKYHRPAFQGKPLALSAVIASQSDDPWQAIEVHTEARDAKQSAGGRQLQGDSAATAKVYGADQHCGNAAQLGKMAE